MPTLTLSDNKNQEKTNQAKKINDSQFDKKVKEFLCAEKNIKLVKALFEKFFEQTKSK